MKRLLAFIWELKWYWLTPLVVVLLLLVLWKVFFGGDAYSIFNYQAF